MAEILISLKVFPADVTTDLNQLKEEIARNLNGKARVYDFQEEPIAFGLKALVAKLVFPEDDQNRQEEIERVLRSIPAVSELQIIGSSRLSR